VTVKRAAVVVVALGLLLVGCGGDEEAASGRVYFLDQDTVWPVARSVDSPEESLEALYGGPTADEVEALGLRSAWAAGDEIPEVSVTAGVALVDVGDDLLPTNGIAQIVYTLTDLSDIDSVEINSRNYTRADFEEQTPSVLVESPLPFEEVTSPITATGTANTFEANFQYELLNADGEVIDENFVTATSGTGTRGTFEFTTADVDDVATLVVFENSAEDGSRVHEVEIPLNPAP
jgi:germination protein M